MRLVVDEGVHSFIVDRLREDGHDVLYIAQAMPGLPDDGVVSVAREQKAIVISDDKDFGELVVRRRLQVYGVVLLRLAGLDGHARARLVADIIRRRGDALAGGITVITTRGIRFRKL
jgi:predicted nuclease of predicted toxin-antitoxin system